MAGHREFADRSVAVRLSAPDTLGKGFRDFMRYRLTVEGAGGGPIEQQRDLIRAGKVVAVLPIDLARDEIVLVRQFRLAAHLANGKGLLVEPVAGRVEAGEEPAACARRECLEETGAAPGALVELFSYFPTPGLTDEEIVVFLADIDAGQIVRRPASPDGEQIETLRVPVDAALATLDEATIHSGPLITALQWLALNRARVRSLLNDAKP